VKEIIKNIGREASIPTDLVIDHETSRLYWVDKGDESSFKLYSALMDGSDKKVIEITI
jgi:hypothetical protein